MNISKFFTFGSLTLIGIGGSIASIKLNFSSSSDKKDLINETRNLMEKSRILIDSSESLKKELETEIKKIQDKLDKYKEKSYMFQTWDHFLAVCYAEVKKTKMPKLFESIKKIYEDWKKKIKEKNKNDNNFENILKEIEESKTTILKIAEKIDQLNDEEHKFYDKLNEIKDLIKKKLGDYENNEDIKKFKSLIQGMWEIYKKNLKPESEKKEDDNNLASQISNKQEALAKILKEKKFKNIEEELRMWFDFFIQNKKISFFKMALESEIKFKKT